MFQSLNSARPDSRSLPKLLTAALVLLAVSLLTPSAVAQGSAELNTIGAQLEGTSTALRGMYLAFRNLVFVICGVVALIVLPAKVQKMQSGDPDSGKSLLQWGGGIVFVAVAAYIIQVIFFS